MAKRIEQIFEECLERIEQGESIESCLASYPDESEELEFMLRTFVNVKWRTSLVEPNPQFKAWGKAQLYNAFNARAHQSVPEKHHGVFSLHRILVPAIAGVMIFILLGSVGTAAASNSAMPDQPLYPVKLATEEVRLAFSFSDMDKAVVNTEIAERRAQEIAAMAELGKTDYVVATTERMLNNLESAEQAINKVFGEAPEQPVSVSEIPPQPVSEPQPQLEPQPQPQPVVQPESQPEPKPEPQLEPGASQEQEQEQEQKQEQQSPDSDNVTNVDNKDGKENQQTSEQIKNERIKRSFEASFNKNVMVLEKALDNAPKDTKSAIQNALDIAKNKKEWIEYQNRFNWQDRNRNGIPDKDENLPQKGIVPGYTVPSGDQSSNSNNGTKPDTTLNNTSTRTSDSGNNAVLNNTNNTATDFIKDTTSNEILPPTIIRSPVMDITETIDLR